MDYRKLFENVGRILPDKVYLSLTYLYHFGKIPSFNAPITFNEKLQWLKLNDRQELYTVLVDKIKVKQYVEDKIDKSVIIPTLAVWSSADKVSIDDLPDRFVIKCNHDSKSVYICKDKEHFNLGFVKQQLKKNLRTNAYWYGREWPYKNVKPLIFAEDYLDTSADGDLFDYKIHCFNGKAKIVLVCSNRFSDEGLCEDFYDLNWNLLDLCRPQHLNSKNGIPRPKNFEKMIEIAEKLSRDIPFARIDLYNIDGAIYFGEITLYPAAGLEKFNSKEWDKQLGNMLVLPENTD